MDSFSIDIYSKLMESHKFEEVDKYRASFIPTYLFKFISLGTDVYDNKLDTVANDKIWVAKGVAQNDPFEFKGYYLDEERLIDVGYPKEAIDTLHYMMSGIDKAIFIASFTTKMNDCIPMWAHYTNNHKGFCVKYRLTDKNLFYKVSYEPEMIKSASIVTNYYAEMRKSFDSKTEPSDEANFYQKLLSFKYFMKHDSWKYEDEYRLVMPLGHRPENGYAVEHDMIGLKVENIYAGLKCSDAHKKKLSEICESLNIGKLINITTSKTSYIFEEEYI